MDEAALSGAADDAAAIGRLRSLLVARRGKLVLERYYGGADRESPADVRSVTKSVVSTLVGIALERGELVGLDQPVANVLDGAGIVLTGRQRDITLRHLLSMTAGFEWDESGASGNDTMLYNEWVLSGDPVGFLLERPLADPPGTRFEYNSAAVHLLGVVLEEATGSTLPAYADRVLFGPLGIGDARWEPLGGGRVNGGSGLDLRPRDLARFGQLMLQDGWSGEHSVVPAPWVREATTRRFEWTVAAGPLASLSYGYLWWVDTERDAFLAWGFGGQFIYVSPALEVVVVATTEWRRSGEVGGPEVLAEEVLGVIVNGVLASAR
jgi:CubicO group peptidase (beta-lactamase class C family)